MVNCAKAGDEMTFESLNGTFGFVAAVDAGRSELEIHVFLVHEGFQ